MRHIELHSALVHTPSIELIVDICSNVFMVDQFRNVFFFFFDSVVIPDGV